MTTIGFTEVKNKPYPFDIDFSNDVDQLKSAIYISLFCNKREISPEFANKNIPQNGWFGNLIMFNGQDFQIGSYLWTLKQSVLDQDTINLVLSYTEEALEWLIDDGILEDLEVNFVDVNGNILTEESLYNYFIGLSYIILEIKVKPFLKNEIKYSLNIKTNC